MKKYLIPVALLAAKNEYLSLFALMVMGAMLIWDILNWMAEGKW